jgi:hypothetical protein
MARVVRWSAMLTACAVAFVPAVATGQEGESQTIRGEDPTPGVSQAEGRGFVRAVTDTWITAKTKIALFADERVRGRDVHVNTRNGVVALRGDVESADARAAAEAVARGIEGVQDVRNELRVRRDDDRAGAMDRAGLRDGGAQEPPVFRSDPEPANDQITSVAAIASPDMIRLAQQRLRERGFDPGEITGVVDERTQAAIREFQTAEGLRNTGRLDIATRFQLGLDM